MSGTTCCLMNKKSMQPKTLNCTRKKTKEQKLLNPDFIGTHVEKVEIEKLFNLIVVRFTRLPGLKVVWN
jgi:hypothetical protein